MSELKKQRGKKMPWYEICVKVPTYSNFIVLSKHDIIWS